MGEISPYTYRRQDPLSRSSTCLATQGRFRDTECFLPEATFCRNLLHEKAWCTSCGRRCTSGRRLSTCVPPRARHPRYLREHIYEENPNHRRRSVHTEPLSAPPIR